MTRILGISGSLRSGSYNTALLRAARDVAGDGIDVEVATLHGIPLYDADLETRDGVPAPVVVLDVPLLVRAGWVAECDRVVVLACDDGVRRARIAARHSPAQIAAREAAWNRDPPDRLPAAKVRTVDTGRDVAYTRHQIEHVWRDLRGPS